MSRSIWWPALVALGLLQATAARAEVIHDAKLGFTLTLPEGFRDFPAGRQQPNTPHSFIKGEPGTDDFAIVGIEPMGGTIGREPLKALPQADGIKFDKRREKWKSFDIDVMIGVARQGQVALYVLVAQVPLKPEAIQLKLVAPEARQGELLALLRTLLAGLDGPSNWLTDAERGRSAGRAVGALAVLLGLAVWLFARWRKGRKPPASEAGPGSAAR